MIYLETEMSEGVHQVEITDPVADDTTTLIVVEVTEEQLGCLLEAGAVGHYLDGGVPSVAVMMA